MGETKQMQKHCKNANVCVWKHKQERDQKRCCTNRNSTLTSYQSILLVISAERSWTLYPMRICRLNASHPPTIVCLAAGWERTNQIKLMDKFSTKVEIRRLNRPLALLEFRMARIRVKYWQLLACVGAALSLTFSNSMKVLELLESDFSCCIDGWLLPRTGLLVLKWP